MMWKGALKLRLTFRTKKCPCETAFFTSMVGLTIHFQGRNSEILFLIAFLIGADSFLNPIALRKAKIVYNFGLSECNRVKE